MQDTSNENSQASLLTFKLVRPEHGDLYADQAIDQIRPLSLLRKEEK